MSDDSKCNENFKEIDQELNTIKFIIDIIPQLTEGEVTESVDLTIPLKADELIFGAKVRSHQITRLQFATKKGNNYK